jgi:membrane protein DedA with SNARE-associated domain
VPSARDSYRRSVDIITWIQQSADQIPEVVRWLAAAAFAALEVLGLGPFIPGEIAVLLLGASFSDPLHALVLVVAVLVGASAGDHVLYLVGRRFGKGMRETRFVRRLGVGRWDAAIAVVERRGPIAIVATRLVPVVRTLTPLAAGTAGLPLARFSAASLIGSATWALAWGGTGFLLRSSITVAEQLLGSVTWIVAGAVALIVLAVVGVRFARKRGLLRRVRVTRGGVVTWVLLLTAVELVVDAALTGGGAELGVTVERLLGLGTAVALTASVVVTGAAEPRSRAALVNAAARFVALGSGVVTAIAVHGVPVGIGIPLFAVIGLVEVLDVSGRTATTGRLLAAPGIGFALWPWAWSGSFAVVGTAVSLALFAAFVIGIVAVVRALRDRAVGTSPVARVAARVYPCTPLRVATRPGKPGLRLARRMDRLGGTGE